MTRLEDIQQKERTLLDKEDTLISERKQLQRIQEQYSDQFRDATRFFERLNYQFQQSSERSFFESLSDEFSQKSRQITERLEVDGDELHAQKQAIERQRDDLAYEKQRFQKEESENEY